MLGCCLDCVLHRSRCIARVFCVVAYFLHVRTKDDRSIWYWSLIPTTRTVTTPQQSPIPNVLASYWKVNKIEKSAVHKLCLIKRGGNKARERLGHKQKEKWPCPPTKQENPCECRKEERSIKLIHSGYHQYSVETGQGRAAQQFCHSHPARYQSKCWRKIPCSQWCATFLSWRWHHFKQSCPKDARNTCMTCYSFRCAK
jgi:hypothetical protein